MLILLIADLLLGLMENYFPVNITICTLLANNIAVLCLQRVFIGPIKILMIYTFYIYYQINKIAEASPK